MDTIAKALDEFLAAADSAVGTDYTAVLYGSAARGDYEPAWSNINVLLLLEDVSPARLRALGPAFARWRERSAEPPLIMSRDEWRQASDVFPLELTDMRAAYRVLRGDDPVRDVHPNRADVRLGLERELRGKLLRLRQGYTAVAGDEEALGALASRSAGTVLLLFRLLLELVGRPGHRAPLDVAGAAASVVGFDTEQVTYVLRHRADKRPRCPAPQFEEYLAAVERTARYVDQLQLGDQR